MVAVMGLTRLGFRSSGHHLDVPGAVGYAICDVCVHRPRHARRLACLVGQTKRDRIIGKSNRSPGTVRPVVSAAMKRVLAVVPLSVVCLSINGELCLADPVGVPTWYGIVCRMAGVPSCVNAMV